MMRKLMMLFLLMPTLLGVGCPFMPPATENDNGPYVNLQVTEYKDLDGFERIVSELENRGLKATILTMPDFVTENCERIKELADKGYEIMAFARPDEVNGESVTLSMLTYEEQETLITQTKTAIEACIGRSINGFRCTRFDQNEDTYAILQNLGFLYNLGFVSHSENCMPGHQGDVMPYRDAGYDFWAVPMHSASVDGDWVAFCDNPFKRLMNAASWGEMIKSELDSMRAQGRPLMVEVHPYYSGVDDDAFAAFVGFLDYAQQQNARFIPISELVTLFGQTSTDGGTDDGSAGDGGCDLD